MVTIGAARNGLGDIAVSNVGGSNVFNLVGIFGVAAAVRPLFLSEAVAWSLWWLIAISVVVAAFWAGR